MATGSAMGRQEVLAVVFAGNALEQRPVARLAVCEVGWIGSAHRITTLPLRKYEAFIDKEL
jgi:hypothetical protein